MKKIATCFVMLFVLVMITGCSTTQDVINEKKNAVLFIVNESVIKVEKSENSNYSIGTGYIIGENKIVTNAHVVNNSSKLSAKLENSTDFYDLETVFIDPIIDVAIVKFKDWNSFADENKYEVLKFADSSAIKTIDEVYAIGNPWGFAWSVTKGIVVNKLRRLEQVPQFTIQTDAYIFSGNSGGPLLNSEGEIIGMNSIMYANTGGSFGFAIHANIVKKVLNDFELYKEVRWPTIGVELNSDLTVENINANSAAANSDLKKYDKIISIQTTFGKVDVKNVDELIFTLASIDYNQQISFLVLRDNALFRINITPKYKLSKEFPMPIRKQ